MNKKDRKHILLTGATGFVGRHLLPMLEDYAVHTLGRSPGCDIVCDLEWDTPRLERSYDMVIHLAGTDDYDRADALNNHGTKRLLHALEAFPPRCFTLMSTVQVYGDDPGEDVDENCFMRPDNPYSRSKIRAEKEVEEWCGHHSVRLVVLRPAPIAGNGMHGRLARMAEAVRRGRYIHIRGNDARRSLVMVCDVVSAICATAGMEGVYNVTDGACRTITELADAMACNFANDKRLLVVPSTPLKALASVSALLPPLHRRINNDILRRLTTSATYSNKKIVEAAGIRFYDTVEVIARREKTYPYEYEP